MQKLTKDELPGILPVKRGRMTLLRAELEKLQVGEVLFMPRAEWKTKSSPRYIINAIKKKSGLRFEWGFKTDGTGWLFRRVA